MVDILAVGNVSLTKQKDGMLKERKPSVPEAEKEVRNKYIKYRF